MEWEELPCMNWSVWDMTASLEKLFVWKEIQLQFKARIKKIMQADEDVGKMALTVPVLVSKALELFLQDVCDRTYGITLQRGAKTMNSLHLKHCVRSLNVFDFLKEIVSKVPDYGHSDALGIELFQNEGKLQVVMKSKKVMKNRRVKPTRPAVLMVLDKGEVEAVVKFISPITLEHC